MDKAIAKAQQLSTMTAKEKEDDKSKDQAKFEGKSKEQKKDEL